MSREVSLGGRNIRLLLAPMAGYTDVAFRTLAREYGAQLTVTEMVSVRGLVRGGEGSRLLTVLSPEEKPSCVQLFGNDPEEFAACARLLDCDIIDINMGCPMPKIVKNGDGAALMKDPVLAGEIVRAAVSSGKQVTVKTRLGYSRGKVTADELIKRVADGGASAVTVHGRFAEQKYEGECDLDEVAMLAALSPVPVIPSGNITRSNLADVLSTFGAAMIGRGALSDIGIFSGERADNVAVAGRHIELLEKYFDEHYTVIQARKFFVHYFKNIPGGKAARAAVNAAGSAEEVRQALSLLA